MSKRGRLTKCIRMPNNHPPTRAAATHKIKEVVLTDMDRLINSTGTAAAAAMLTTDMLVADSTNWFIVRLLAGFSTVFIRSLHQQSDVHLGITAPHRAGSFFHWSVPEHKAYVQPA